MLSPIKPGALFNGHPHGENLDPATAKANYEAALTHRNLNPRAWGFGSAKIGGIKTGEIPKGKTLEEAEAAMRAGDAAFFNVAAGLPGASAMEATIIEQGKEIKRLAAELAAVRKGK